MKENTVVLDGFQVGLTFPVMQELMLLNIQVTQEPVLSH